MQTQNPFAQTYEIFSETFYEWVKVIGYVFVLGRMQQEFNETYTYV